MAPIDLSWTDLNDIAIDCIAPSAAELLDALEAENQDDVIAVAQFLRDAAQAVIDGRV